MKNIIILSLAAIAFSGCGKGRGINAAKGVATALEERDLQHSYHSQDCSFATEQATSISSSIKSVRRSYDFTLNKVDIKDTFFSSTDCTTGELYSVIERGTFNLDKAAKTKDGAHNIDMSIKKALIKATSDGQPILSKANICNKNDWPAEEVDVTGQSGEKNCLGQPHPFTIFNIYRLNEGKLTLGKDAIKEIKAEERPQTLNGKAYVK